MSDPNSSAPMQPGAQPAPHVSHEAPVVPAPASQPVFDSGYQQPFLGGQQAAPAQAVQAQAAPAQGTPIQAAPAQAAHGQVAPGSDPAAGESKGLSTFLKVSIVLLAALTIASISLLFIGGDDGKPVRVFSTFALFAVFVFFTALDTRSERKSEWYAPVALVANAYILALLLVVIWMTRYTPVALLLEIFWKSVFVILVTRLVILCCQLLLRAGVRLPEVVTRFAFVTSVIAVLSGILFTAPVGIAAFDLEVPDLYWKIATAMLILTALGLSITLLLRWSFGAADREAARVQRAAEEEAFAASNAAAAWQLAGGVQQPGVVLPGAVQPAVAQPAVQQQVPGGPVLLPWPTFADGRPLPAGPDGQPDFSVLRNS